MVFVCPKCAVPRHGVQISSLPQYADGSSASEGDTARFVTYVVHSSLVITSYSRRPFVHTSSYLGDGAQPIAEHHLHDGTRRPWRLVEYNSGRSLSLAEGLPPKQTRSHTTLVLSITTIVCRRADDIG